MHIVSYCVRLVSGDINNNDPVNGDSSPGESCNDAAYYNERIPEQSCSNDMMIESYVEMSIVKDNIDNLYNSFISSKNFETFCFCWTV